MGNSKHKKIYVLYDKDENLYGRGMFEINKLNGKGKERIEGLNSTVINEGNFLDDELNRKGKKVYRA